MWGLAEDGKTDDKGMPSLLQMVAIGREFDDVIRFAKPPRLVQKLLFGLLAPSAGADHGFTHAKPVGVAREAIELIGEHLRKAYG